MRLSQLLNIKGDLFATGSSYFAVSCIRFGSSLILTRILIPQEYGIMTILMSVIYILQMIGDLGINFFIVRDKRAEEPSYRNTAWTIGLARAVLNMVVLLLFAPLIASLYKAPTLTAPLRVISSLFVITALQSMSFPLAIRKKRSRIIVYSEAVVALATTIFTITYCYYSRDFWGMVYGTLFGTLLYTIISYFFYPEFRPKLQFDKAAAREVFALARFTSPSSVLTLVCGQFDKAVFLRFFDLNLLGIYGLANNLADSVQGLVVKISQMVFYPRVAHSLRDNPAAAPETFYTANVKLIISILVGPALVGGSAHLIIHLFYPSRYGEAAVVLQALMVRVALLAFANPAEDLLIAAGESHVILVGSVMRAIGTIGGSLIGYWLFGFIGFVYGLAFSALPQLIYYMHLQRKRKLLTVRYELYKVAFVCVIAISAYWGSNWISVWLPPLRR